MKPRITVWGNPRQCRARRGDECIVVDLDCFDDQHAAWQAMTDWCAGTDPTFTLEPTLRLRRIGFLPYWSREWSGTEIYADR